MDTIPNNPTSRYRALVSAAHEFVGSSIFDDESPPTLHQALEYLAGNEAVLQFARELVRRGCEVPLRYDVKFIDEVLADLQSIRGLARSFALAARQAAENGELDEMVEWCLDLLALANGVRRGGLILHFQISLCAAGLAFEQLRRYRDVFHEVQRRRLIGEMTRLIGEREPATTVCERDRHWEESVNYPEDEPDWEEVLPDDAGGSSMDAAQVAAVRSALQAITELPSTERQSLHENLDRRELALHRLFVVDLAIRSHRENSGYLPNSLGELQHQVSLYDPLSGHEIHYRRTGNETFQVYSPGPTGIDHGGRFGHWLLVEAGAADMDLDLSDYQDLSAITN